MGGKDILKKKIIAVVSITVAFAATLTIYGIVSAASFFSYDFETGGEWGDPMYDNANGEILSEENGNKYLKLTYNGHEGRGRKYCDVKMTDDGFYEEDTKLIVSYDVCYPETESENRSGEVQIKSMKGYGSSDTTIAARLGKMGEYFMTQGSEEDFQRMRDLNGDFLVIEPGKWYSVSITLDLENQDQSIAVFDRDTRQLLALRDGLETSNELHNINMVSFSTDTSICLDNIYIYTPEGSMEELLYGKSYVSANTQEQYYMLAEDMYTSMLPLYRGDTVWSLEKSRPGVSIDPETGMLTADDNAMPGMVVVKASRTVNDDVYEARTIVNITR